MMMRLTPCAVQVFYYGLFACAEGGGGFEECLPFVFRTATATALSCVEMYSETAVVVLL